MKYRLLIFLFIVSCSCFAAFAQEKENPRFSLKNYCRARSLLNQLRLPGREEKKTDWLIGRITRLSQDEYLLREMYKLAFKNCLQKGQAKGFGYARQAIGHGAEIGCLGYAFPVEQMAVLAEERRKYIVAGFRPQLASFFSAIHDADQYYRLKDLRARNATDLALARKKMRAQDEINEKALLRFVTTNGWPPQRWIDTVDCNYSPMTAFAPMLSHWNIKSVDAVYSRAVDAAKQGLVPWHIPISINNLCLTRRPYMTGAAFSLLDFEFLYTGLANLKTGKDGTIDWTDDQTLLEFLSLGFRMTGSSSDILVLTCSGGYARSEAFALQELTRAKNLVILFGHHPDRIRIASPSICRTGVLPGDRSLIGVWTVRIGNHPTIVSLMKDGWLLDNKMDTDDFDHFFLRR